MHKYLLALALLAVSMSASALTVGPNCGLAWDYPPEQEVLLDGFKVYVDNVAVADVPAAERGVPCSVLGLTAGERTFEVTAFNAVGESAKSNAVTVQYVDQVPDFPQNLRINFNVSIELGL
jgi:hypothetical protein